MSAEMIDMPEHSAVAEMEVIAGMLLEERAIWTAKSDKRLRAEMFYDRRNQILCQAIFDMVSDGRSVDGITLSEWLRQRKLLEKAGGWEWLNALRNEYGVVRNIADHVDVIVDKYLWREMTHQSWMVMADIKDALKEGRAAEDFLKILPERFFGIIDGLETELSNAQVLDTWHERMVAIKKGEVQPGLPLPWEKLDRALGGLKTGLILIGARPSCGKTTFEVNITNYLARQGHPVGRVCMDMSKEGLLSRSVVCESRVSLPRMEKGGARWSHLETVRECVDLVKSWPIYVNSVDTNIHSICAWARMTKARYGIELLTVDFAQLMDSGDGRLDGNMNALLGIVTRKLKKLAIDLDIPVILLSQLNRGSDKEGRRPQLSDLRDSGNLEQNATQVILLSKAQDEDFPQAGEPGYEQSFVLPEDAERRYLRGLIVDVAKNQNGQTGVCCMYLRPNYFRVDAAEEGFMDVKGMLGVYQREAKDDLFVNEDVVCDGDDEEVGYECA